MLIEMTELSVIAVAGFIIFLIGPLLLKSSPVYMFLLLCASELVCKLTSVDATKFTASFIPSKSAPLYTIVQLVIILLVPLIVMFAYKGSLQPKHLLLHILAGISAAILFISLAVAKMPYDLNQKIEALDIFIKGVSFLDVALVVGLFASFFYILAIKPKHEKHAKKHK